MESQIAELLYSLMAGFVAAWIFYGLTPCPKPSLDERVIQAFIFTLLAKITAIILVEILLWVDADLSNSLDSSSLVMTLASACLVGILCVRCYYWDFPHRLLRKLRITDKTIATGWTNAPLEGGYLVLHFRDGRRLHGWVSYYPNNPKDDYFIMTDYQWLREQENPEQKQVAVNANGQNFNANEIRIAVELINMVEFISFNERTLS